MRMTMIVVSATAILGLAACSGHMGMGGTPPAAPGGTTGTGPAAVRNSPADSPVGTGAGGGSPGGGADNGSSGTK